MVVRVVVDHLQQAEPVVQAVLLEALMELLVLHQDVAPHVGGGALVALDGGEGLVGGAVEEVLPDRSGVDRTGDLNDDLVHADAGPGLPGALTHVAGEGQAQVEDGETRDGVSTGQLGEGFTHARAVGAALPGEHAHLVDAVGHEEADVRVVDERLLAAFDREEASVRRRALCGLGLHRLEREDRLHRVHGHGLDDPGHEAAWSFADLVEGVLVLLQAEQFVPAHGQQ